MKLISILLLFTALSAFAADGFKYSISSDVVWPQINYKLKERIEFSFQESDFTKSSVSDVTATLLVEKEGKVNEVILSGEKLNPIIAKEVTVTLKKWKFHPTDEDRAVVMKFSINIET